MSVPPKSVVFRTGASRERAEYFVGETLLDTARRIGVLIPTSCEQGECGSCVVELRKGKVEMTNNNALSVEEIALGSVLACQSIPVSDECEVRID